MIQVDAEHASILVEAAKRRFEGVLDGGHPRRLAHRVYMFCTNGLRFLRTRWFLRLPFQQLKDLEKTGEGGTSGFDSR